MMPPFFPVHPHDRLFGFVATALAIAKIYRQGVARPSIPNLSGLSDMFASSSTRPEIKKTADFAKPASSNTGSLFLAGALALSSLALGHATRLTFQPSLTVKMPDTILRANHTPQAFRWLPVLVGGSSAAFVVKLPDITQTVKKYCSKYRDVLFPRSVPERRNYLFTVVSERFKTNL